MTRGGLPGTIEAQTPLCVFAFGLDALEGLVHAFQELDIELLGSAENVLDQESRDRAGAGGRFALFHDGGAGAGGGVTTSSSQVIDTLLTSALSVPLPLLTLQVWTVGDELMLTAQVLPLTIAPVKVTAPLVALPSLWKAPSLRSSQVTGPDAPATVPLML